jgi:pimeloyl-ACP methyl ester carboxylesterase
MALDALELLDKCLHWDTFHVVGLSMGGMIALELSLLTLHRLLSLSLLVTHAGGLTSIAPVFYSFFRS